MINKLNFHYLTDVKYDTYYECGSTGSCDGDYCRCGVIENARVTEVLYYHILKHLKIDKMSDIDAYCIDRILVINGILKVENFYVSTVSGYYGEEIGDVNFLNAIKVDDYINNLHKLKTNRDKIEYVLNMEYGKVLPQLKNRNWRIKEVSKSDLVFKKRELFQDRVKEYSGWERTFPLAIVTPDDGKYRVWDGYHRCEAFTKNKIKVICGWEKNGLSNSK